MPPVSREGEASFDLEGGSLPRSDRCAHAYRHVGDGLAFEGDDGNEETDLLTPQLRAIDAINPMDRCFSEAPDAGVTTVVTGPR